MGELIFRYAAELTASDQTRRFGGTVGQTRWRSEHLPNETAAAWAFVFKLCDIGGEWTCSVEIAGEAKEERIIKVSTFDDGTVLRNYQPADE